MRLAERKALAYQEVGDIRCIREIRVHSFTHTTFVHLHSGDHRREQLQCTSQRSNRIEHAFFVFLHILVVRQWQ
ncbi:hypothetical protein D3C81_2215330 [compost metagenome]